MPRERVVIKFGGAALRTPGRVARAAARIRTLRRHGVEVVAVVSAPGRSTDRLLGRARSVRERGPVAAPDSGGSGGMGDSRDSGDSSGLRREEDRLLATGEIQSSALLALALLHRGVPARGLSGPEAGLFLAAGRLELEPRILEGLLEEGCTPVVAGFQALDSRGELRTLERGGSDLTAVVVAEGIGAGECHLIKDVAGIYARDPNGSASTEGGATDGATRTPGKPYARLPTEELIALARRGARVVQVDAAERARRAGLFLRICHFRTPALNPGGTLVAPSARSVGVAWTHTPSISLDRASLLRREAS